MQPESLESRILNNSLIFCICTSCFACRDWMNMSWSRCALSIALCTKTPVTTLSTAKYTKAMKMVKTPTQMVWILANGQTASSQVRPSEIDWKSVNIEVLTDPQYLSNLPSPSQLLLHS